MARTPRPAHRASISGPAGFLTMKRDSQPERLIDAIGDWRSRAARTVDCAVRTGYVASALVAGLVHRLDGLIDREQAAGEPGVQHLRERILARAGDHVARLADEILLALLAFHELGEIGSVWTGEVLHVRLDAGLQIDGLDPHLAHLGCRHRVEEFRGQLLLLARGVDG